MRELALVVLVCKKVMFDIYFFWAIFCSFTAKLGVEKGVIPAVFCADTDYITSICVFLFAKAIGDVLHDFFLSFISNFGSSFSI